MAVDVIRFPCPVVATRVPGAGSPCLQVGPAQGGLGDAPAASPKSLLPPGLRGARIRFTHAVQVVPYSCSSARRGGVDGGGIRRRPSAHRPKRQRGSQEVLRRRPGAPVRRTKADARSERLARPVVRPAWCANPAAGGGPRTGPWRRHARPAPGAGRSATAWRCGAIIATASRVAIVRINDAWTATTTAGPVQTCAGKVDDRQWKQRRSEESSSVVDRSGAEQGRPGNSGTRGRGSGKWLSRAE